MQALTVNFQVMPEHADSFRAAILANAASSLENEPGCYVFDVCERAGGEFFLYEVYADGAAIEFHRASAHFSKFDAASAPWIIDKKIGRYEVVGNRIGPKRPS
jgi:autoinducer 2-degrading protein